ncbi:hypothetical protein V6N11_065097 [Hibiscus sabdariffa]|uniref:O-fucosyltransferase family protein n=1 Tax=Hibiscus sabdariffa TaxID=183260 RepID=A0ABR2SIV0_9ROSI
MKDQDVRDFLLGWLFVYGGTRPKAHTSVVGLQTRENLCPEQMPAVNWDIVIAVRLLNLILVVLELDNKSFRADPSDFEDICDVRHSIDFLKVEVYIIRRLRKSKHKVVHFNRIYTRLVNNGNPLDLQKLRCSGNFQGLTFTLQIETLRHKLVCILQGPFVALHLVYDMDMLAFSGCTHDCTVEKEYGRVKACTHSQHPISIESEMVVCIASCKRGHSSENMPNSSWSGPFFLVSPSGSMTVFVPKPSSNAINASVKDLYYKQEIDILHYLGVGQHSQLQWTYATSEERLATLKAAFSHNHSSQMGVLDFIDTSIQFSTWYELISTSQGLNLDGPKLFIVRITIEWGYRDKLVLVFGKGIKRCHNDQKWLLLHKQFSYLFGNAPDWLLPMTIFCPLYKHKLRSVNNEELHEREKPWSSKDLKYLIVILRRALWQLFGVIYSAHFGFENRAPTFLLMLRH